MYGRYLHNYFILLNIVYTASDGSAFRKWHKRLRIKYISNYGIDLFCNLSVTDKHMCLQFIRNNPIIVC